jgi:flagellar P-ring protein precursor FlgI
MGADGSVYAVAQGPVAIGGFSAGGAATSVTQGVPTNGRIASGAIVEQELPFQLNGLKSIRLALKNPDFTTSQRIAKAINNSFGSDLARSADSGTVELTTPMGYENNIAQLITQVEQLNVTPDAPARVVINESTGVVVIGDNVRISRVAIAQGNLTIRVTETPQVSQPGAFAEVGQTTVVDRTKVDVLDDGKEKKLAIVNGGVNLQELVTGLNALGIGPRDMISILQAIKAAGALQAEIEVM